MTDIYLVTEGDYSDYHVVAAFSTEAGATRIADGVDGEVLRLEVDPEIVVPLHPRWHVSMARDGKVQGAWAQNSRLDSYDGQPYEPLTWQLRAGITVHNLNVWCYAESAKHAIKIAAEVLAQVNARNLWRFCEGIYGNFITQAEATELEQAEAQELLSGGGA